MKAVRKVAIVGGARIPFARQNTNYVEASNLQMPTTPCKAAVSICKLLAST